MSAPDVKRSPMEQFKQQLSERVRDDIRDLLPADAVDAMVEEAVRDTFFIPRKVQEGGSYNLRWVEKPSWFVEAVAEAAKPILREAVERYVEQNREVIDKAVAEYLTPQNLTVLAVDRLSFQISLSLDNLAMAIRDRGI